MAREQLEIHDVVKKYGKFTAVDQVSQSTAELESRQFGPGGDDHLFLFTMEEMLSLVPPEAETVHAGYLGGSQLVNSRTHHLFRPFPGPWLRAFIRFLARVPGLNRRTCHNLVMVLRRRP